MFYTPMFTKELFTKAKRVNKSSVHQLLDHWINTVQIHWILFNSEKMWDPVVYDNMNGIRYYY